MTITAIYQLMFSWLPAWVQVVLLGFFAFILILLIVKLVGFILDAIPFL